MAIYFIDRVPAPEYGCSNVTLSFDGISACVKCKFETKNGSAEYSISFANCRAILFTEEARAHLSSGQGSEQIFEVVNSEWLIRLSSQIFPLTDARHFSVFFQDFGMYEFIAESVTPGSGVTEPLRS